MSARDCSALLILVALLLVGCVNPLGGEKRGTEIGSDYHPGLPISAFTVDIPFTFGTDASYTISDASRVELTGGVCRLKPSDQTDNDGTASHFGGATMAGVQWDSTNNYVRLNATTNNAELDPSWTPQWSSLVGYWKLDEAAGASTVADSSGNGITGALGSGVSLGNTCKLNTCVSFSGTSNTTYIDMGTSFNFTTENFTISYWIYLNSLSTNQAGQGPVPFYKGPYQTSGYYEQIAATGQVAFATSQAGAVQATSTATGALVAGQWYHIVTVRSGSSARIYINGIDRTSTTGTHVNPASSASNFRLGIYSVLGTMVLNGYMDDVAIWSTNLNPTEVQTVYERQSAKYSGQLTSRVMDGLATGQSWTSFSSTSTLPFYKELPGSSGSESSANYSSQSVSLMNGIVGYWNLNTNFNAQVGSNLTASSTGASIVTTNQKFGSGSASFDGASYAAASASSTYSFPNTTFSVSFWFSSTMPASSWIISNGLTNTGGGWAVQAANGRLTAVLGNANSAWISRATSSVTFNDGTWHHAFIQFTTDTSTETNNLIQMYIDGNLNQGAMSYPGTGAYVDPSATASLALGARKVPASPIQYYTGYIDEVAIWSRSLSSAEILELYRRGANRLKYQVRSCSANDCSDQQALTSSGQGWKGPDNTQLTYFSELYNTMSNVLGGTVSTGSPTMTFSNFSGLGLSVSSNRYFQYRTILESDDANTLCNYGSGATACSPELQSVSVGPTHYDTTAQTITSKASIGSAYQALDANGFTETLGAGSCSAGAKYALSPNGTSFYYWNGSAWAPSSDYSTASDSAAIRANLSTFPGTAGSGTLQIKTFLKSSGTSACEVDNLRFSGMK